MVASLLSLRRTMKDKTQIWTIGHSNRSIDEFLKLLKKHEIQVLVDIRSFPTSKIEHFKKAHMKKWLPENCVEYIWLGEALGGHRKGGYKRHIRTKLFKKGIEQLLEVARDKRACIMCMEVDPKYCHRKFVATYLEVKGVAVNHITVKGQQGLPQVLNPERT